MEKSYITQWQEVGHKICAGFSDRLDDHAAGINYSDYIYAVCFFDGINGTGPTPDNVLKHSLQVLSRRRSSISSSSPLKNLLGEFISISNIIFATSQSRQEALQLMKSEKLLPDVVDELGASKAFVEERYDERLEERFKVKKSEINKWQRLNWTISAIGEWFGEYGEAAASVISFLVGGGVALSAVIAIINVFVEEGAMWGILALIFIGFIGYWATIILFAISFYLSKILFAILRCVFYNIYTLLLVIGLVLWQTLWPWFQYTFLY